MDKRLILKELSRYPLGTFADLIYRNAILYPESEAFVWGSERTCCDRVRKIRGVDFLKAAPWTLRNSGAKRNFGLTHESEPHTICT